MSYIDAFYDRKKDKINIVERVNGKRVLIESKNVKHVFYYENPMGHNKTIYGHQCSIYSTNDFKKFRKELSEKQEKHRIFESDINPVFRYLADNYKNVPAPELNVCFFDIEVDLDITKGYAPTDNPFSPITAITLYLSETKSLITLALCPPTLKLEQAKKIASNFENTFCFSDEKELLDMFLNLIENADVITSWNGEMYDIPYTVNRVERILGKEATKRFCLFEQYPKAREYKKFQKTFKTYELIGRVHLDYLILYQKHNPQQQQSYRLDNIGEIEVGENKIPYEGTIDKLWRDDFDKFIAYNRQDVDIMVKIDEKKKFIELSNQIAHANCVLFKTTIGTVSLVEQSIINEMHEMGLIVPNRPFKDWDNEDDFDIEEKQPVVGAYVAHPKTGKHQHIGCGDINSLYPSAIRALNMSPETLVGQIRLDKTNQLVADRIASGIDRASAWEGIFIALEVQQMLDNTDDILTVDFEDKLTDVINTKTFTAKEFYEYIFNPNNHLCITANGTIFRTDVEGIIPALLEKWYKLRKEYQFKEKDFKNKSLQKDFTEQEKLEFKNQSVFFNQRQYVYKILLNALYGALLNDALRFYDGRIGQSTTLSGRTITKHMNSMVNEIITGKYDYQGEAIFAVDTDSVAKESIINTNFGDISIEHLFYMNDIKWIDGQKEYSRSDKIKVKSFDEKTNQVLYKCPSYVYRHKTKKKKWKITDTEGNSVVITEDHSIMVERENKFIEIKPENAMLNDILIKIINT
jgi:DNA polymerase elongation subunit (family B)